MRNSAYTQKSIVSASIKIVQLNFYSYQQQSSLFYTAIQISSIAPLGNKVSTAIKCSVLPTDN